MTAAWFAAALMVTFTGAERPKVVVVPLVAVEGAPEGAAMRFTSLVTDDLKGRDEVLELAGAPAAPSAQRPSTSGGQAAANAFEAARKALDELRFDEAASLYKKGLDVALNDPAHADFAAVADAYLNWGVASFRLEDDAATDAALVNLARLVPNYSVPAGFPPAFTRTIEKARKKAERLPKGGVVIDAPSGSTVYVDGREVGKSPTVSGLALGAHYIRIDGPGGERSGHVVDVRGGVLQVKAGFGNSERRTASEPKVGAVVDASTLERLKNYAVAAGADYALFGVLYPSNEQQLTAATMLLATAKDAAVALPPSTFDAAVLTANVEAFRLGDELEKRLKDWGESAVLPKNLVGKVVRVAAAAKASGDNVNPNEGARVVLKPMAVPEARPLERPSQWVDTTAVQPNAEPPPEEVKAGVPPWVWVVAGVVAAAGIGVGTYFGVSYATKPVTGTVTATW